MGLLKDIIRPVVPDDPIEQIVAPNGKLPFDWYFEIDFSKLADHTFVNDETMLIDGVEFVAKTPGGSDYVKIESGRLKVECASFTGAGLASNVAVAPGDRIAMCRAYVPAEGLENRPILGMSRRDLGWPANTVPNVSNNLSATAYPFVGYLSSNCNAQLENRHTVAFPWWFDFLFLISSVESGTGFVLAREVGKKKWARLGRINNSTFADGAFDTYSFFVTGGQTGFPVEVTNFKVSNILPGGLLRGYIHKLFAGESGTVTLQAHDPEWAVSGDFGLNVTAAGVCTPDAATLGTATALRDSQGDAAQLINIQVNYPSGAPGMCAVQMILHYTNADNLVYGVYDRATGVLAVHEVVAGVDTEVYSTTSPLDPVAGQSAYMTAYLHNDASSRSVIRFKRSGNNTWYSAVATLAGSYTSQPAKVGFAVERGVANEELEIELIEVHGSDIAMPALSSLLEVL